MIILPMLLLIRILANSTLRFHITGPGTRLNLRSKIKSINQSIIIRQLAVRGAQRLGFLRKASAVLDPKHRAIVYRGFVRPVLEYGMLVWMSAAPTTLARLTAIQRRALHIIGDGAYLPSLDIRRTVAGLCFLYKLHFVEGPEMVKAILPPSAAAPQHRMPTRATTRSATHHPSQLTSIHPPQARNNTLRSFPHSLIETWNQLPPTLLQSPLLAEACTRSRKTSTTTCGAASGSGPQTGYDLCQHTSLIILTALQLPSTPL